MPTGFYPRKPLKERFLEKVEISAGCWRWVGAFAWNGYGRIGNAGKTHQAHRVSYELFNGPAAAGLDVMHSCDNRWCVNPAHLSLGTRKDNMSDCSAKGRSTFGERSVLSKLTNAQAQEIRRAYQSGSENQRQLAERFGIHQTTVHYIVRGKSWKREAV